MNAVKCWAATATLACGPAPLAAYGWHCSRCTATGTAMLCLTHRLAIQRDTVRPCCDACADNGRLFVRLVLDVDAEGETGAGDPS